jgi:hypothetical protein
MKVLDRRISVAPMMDWSDEVKFGSRHNNLCAPKSACRLFVASLKNDFCLHPTDCGEKVRSKDDHFPRSP